MTNTNILRRRAAGVSLMLAPVALLLGMIIDPSPESGQTEGLAYAAHPGQVGISALLLHYCWVLLVPGVVGLLNLVRRRGAVLANIAGVVALLGLINMSGLLLVDYIESSLFRALPPDQASAILDDAATSTLIFGWQLPGLAGTLLGLILTGIAVARARVAGWWFPIGIVAGLVLFVFGAQSGMLLLGVAGPIVLTITFGAVGLTLIRMRDAEPVEAHAAQVPVAA